MECGYMNYYFTGVLIIMFLGLAIFGGPSGY
jgi:hypothetical protein